MFHKIPKLKLYREQITGASALEIYKAFRKMKKIDYYFKTLRKRFKVQLVFIFWAEKSVDGNEFQERCTSFNFNLKLPASPKPHLVTKS